MENIRVVVQMLKEEQEEVFRVRANGNHFPWLIDLSRFLKGKIKR
jgi:hypothetical protein